MLPDRSLRPPRLTGFIDLSGIVPGLVHQIVPPVGPADIEVHENPGHRELREGVDVSQVYGPDDVYVQQRGERRQKRQTEVEDQEEDRRRNDERFPLLRQLPERRRPFDTGPLIVPLHRTPSLSPTYCALYCKRMHTVNRGCGGWQFVCLVRADEHERRIE